MGLDLRAGDELHVHLTSGGVHEHRRLCILSFLASADTPEAEQDVVRAWLTDQPSRTSSIEMLKDATHLEAAPDANDAPAGINYDAIPQAYSLERGALCRGLWHWVNHSDSDGEHASAAVTEVAYSLTRLASTARQVGGARDHTESLYRIADFYVQARDAGLAVEFS
jgi:hypothetical protein